MVLADKINPTTGRRMLINEGIESMEFSVKINTYCPLGKNITEKQVNTVVKLGKYIPDLLDIEDLVQELNNGCFINEDLGIEWKKRLSIYEFENIQVYVLSSGHFPLKYKIK